MEFQDTYPTLSVRAKCVDAPGNPDVHITKTRAFPVRIGKPVVEAVAITDTSDVTSIEGVEN